MEHRSVSLIEFSIISIITIVIAVIVAVGFVKLSMPRENVSYGINGLAEIRCISGYKFVVGRNGTVQQILNENHGGVLCNHSTRDNNELSTN